MFLTMQTSESGIQSPPKNHCHGREQNQAPTERVEKGRLIPFKQSHNE